MASENTKLQFTIIDTMIIESYKSVIDGLAEYLGQNYEIVLHSLVDLENSVIYIKNGFHTGRKIGAPITNMALEMLSKIDNESTNDITYFTKNKNGEPVKSSTIAIRGENNRIIGLMCINFFLNSSFLDVISDFYNADSGVNRKKHEFMYESFSDDPTQLIISAIKDSIDEVDLKQEISTTQRNKAIISLLFKKNIFKLKNSVVIVAQELKVSKNTVYMHLRSCDCKI